MNNLTYYQEVRIAEILDLIEKYGDERAVKAYHGELHCRRKPEDLLADISYAITELAKND